jgi:hypothetical protein
LCFVSETKGQDQPEDENAAKARPELEQGETIATHLTTTEPVYDDDLYISGNPTR